MTRHTFSIKQLAFAFLGVVIAMMGLIAAFAAYQTHAVTRSLDQSSLDAARAELAAQFESLHGHLEEQVANLARWDETRQQFLIPEHYAYWRGQRVHESGMLTSWFATVALYTQAGLPLGADAEPGFPATLPAPAVPHRPSAWLAHEGEAFVLYHGFPVYGDESRQALLGYGLVRTDFMPALLRQKQFHFTDTDSVALALAPGETLDADKLFSRLTYTALPAPHQPRFQKILSRTLLSMFGVLAVMTLFGFMAYNRLLVRPLGRLASDIDDMQQGRFHERREAAQPMRVIELEAIRRSLHDYQLQLRKLHGSLESQNREFHAQARQDALTGCYNRRAYEEDWADYRQALKDAPHDVAFLLFDCDRFKTINDTYGHAKGDRVLTTIAGALVMALRANDRLYRLGGDEFATFLPHTTLAQARQIAQRCQSLIEAAAFGDLGIGEPVSISIGIAHCAAAQVDEVDELPKRADIAMYTAKQPGRHRIAMYGDDPDRASQTLVASRETNALFQALAAPGMIELHYQAIHRLPDRTVDYYEALARIRYHGELILPAAFLPVVVNRRLEGEFDLAVLQQVDADLTAARVPAGAGISINVSAQSLARADVISQLLELSRHNGRHPLMLEITETSLVTQMDDVRSYLDLLGSVNYRIAMDDFGTGYSPLRYLVDLPVDVIKFDMSLVAKLGDTDRAATVVADLVHMMKDAGYALVAEGVESADTLARVESLGFSHVQGYLLGHPLPPAALALAETHTGADARIVSA